MPMYHKGFFVSSWLEVIVGGGTSEGVVVHVAIDKLGKSKIIIIRGVVATNIVACVGIISHGDPTLRRFEVVVGATNVVSVETNVNLSESFSNFSKHRNYKYFLTSWFINWFLGKVKNANAL